MELGYHGPPWAAHLAYIISGHSQSNLWDSHTQLHITNGKSEGQRGSASYPRLHSHYKTEQGLSLRSIKLLSLGLCPADTPGVWSGPCVFALIKISSVNLDGFILLHSRLRDMLSLSYGWKTFLLSPLLQTEQLRHRHRRSLGQRRVEVENSDLTESR